MFLSESVFSVMDWAERFGFPTAMTIVFLFVFLRDKIDWQRKVITALQQNSITDTTTQQMILMRSFPTASTDSAECTEYAAELVRVNELLQKQGQELQRIMEKK
jgi:hypothetical protein